MSTIEFFVPGKSEPQGSKTRGRFSIYDDNPNTKPWRERIALVAAETTNGSPILHDVPIALWLTFVMPRPVSTPKRRTPPAVKRPDLDKCIRAVCDALTNVIYANDSAVIDIGAHKRLANIDEQPGVHIVLTAITADQPAPRPGFVGFRAGGPNG